MGLANLVPGISGGTMLLAVGIYPRFIEAVADTTRLRPRLQPLLLLSVVAVAGGLAILLLAGLLRDLVVHQRWMMYSAFIGLTLGGAPLVWRLAAGAAAMILPGLSGAYLLLVLGQYETVLGAVDLLFQGLRGLDAADLLQAGAVLLPVLIGIALGATVISNAVQLALRRFRQATLGVLLGLLLGAAVGLWPFEASPPGAVQLGSAVVLAAAGFVLTWGVGRLGRVPAETTT